MPAYDKDLESYEQARAFRAQLLERKAKTGNFDTST